MKHYFIEEAAPLPVISAFLLTHILQVVIQVNFIYAAELSGRWQHKMSGKIVPCADTKNYAMAATRVIIIMIKCEKKYWKR